MRIQKIGVVLLLILIFSCDTKNENNVKSKTKEISKIEVYRPEKLFGELFHKVQVGEVFPDVKTFPDCTPLEDPKEIMKAYVYQKNQKDFNLRAFVLKYFQLPKDPISKIKEKQDKEKINFEENIINLWEDLTRQPDKVTGRNSLIALPNKYVVPGGRFKEIYYWDSYFTMIGLAASGKIETVEAMLENFSYMIDKFGFIPNGNRTYYLSRSQPPFFSSMVMLYAKYVGNKKAAKYLPFLEKEYAFWMQGKKKLSSKNLVTKKVVLLKNGGILNRYQDTETTLRPEGYLTDIVVLEKVAEERKEEVMSHRRATCESGWDFSSRWLNDANDGIEKMVTSNIIPVDLNCLLFHLEKSIAELSLETTEKQKNETYNILADKRKSLILKYCWNEKLQCFTDYNFVLKKQSNQMTLASNFPLYYKIATKEQAHKQEKLMREKFLFSGGLTTTLTKTGEQWDYPNGWAPLQWISIKGLEHYNQKDLANTIQKRWITLNKKVFNETGKMMEKYNVVDTSLTAGGGEYPTVDGFGWTNGVAIALLKNTDKY